MLYILLSIIIIIPVLAGFGEIFKKFLVKCGQLFRLKYFQEFFLWQCCGKY
jgi:hypothetical protein